MCHLAAATDCQHRGLDGAGDCSGFHHVVGALAAHGVQDGLDGFFLGHTAGVDHLVCAGLLGQLQTFVVDVHHDHLCAHGLGHPHRRQTHRASAIAEDPLADGGLQDVVHGASTGTQGTADGAGQLQVEVVRDLGDAALVGDAVFRKRGLLEQDVDRFAVTSQRSGAEEVHAVQQDVQVSGLFAVPFLALVAGVALAAGGVGDDDVVARLDLGDAGPTLSTMPAPS